MSKITTLSLFVSCSVIVSGIHYDNLYLIMIGAFMFIASSLALLHECGHDLRNEIERAN